MSGSTDALATLRAAISQKPGLRPIPLASESYELDSRPGSATRLVNLYAEKMPSEARGTFILKPSPGLRPLLSVGTGPIYKVAAMPGFVYIVSGSQFWRISVPDPQQPAFLAGTVPAVYLGEVGLSGAPSIAIGPTQVVIVNPPNAYVAAHDGPISQITVGSGNFPEDGASSVVWIDGYFVFTSFGGDRFFISKLLDATHYDSLDFATSERRPDYVQYSIAHNGELWLFGQIAGAVWYDSGDVDFPFRERTGANFAVGIGSTQTLAELDNSLFWLGNDRLVYRSNGYRPLRVSTHAIEEELTKIPDLRVVTGCAFMFEGHAFYSLSLPTQTYIYDVSTGLWHSRSSQADGLNRWRGGVAVQFVGTLLIGDAFGSTLCILDKTSTFDFTTPLKRIAVLPDIVSHGPRWFMSRFEAEMEVGTADAPGSIVVDWSDDGGYNFGVARTLSTGAVGQTRTRVAATRLGSFRQRMMRLQTTGFLTVYGADADMEPGAA